MSKIIAVIGMCGAGKSETVKFFLEKRYERVYFGDCVFEEMKKTNLEINERNERATRERLRKEYGMAAMAVLSLDKIKEYATHANVVIESLYSWEEFKVLKEVFGEDFKLLAIYTTKDLRYSRLLKRPSRPLSKEEAISRDLSEIEKLNKGGPIAYADFLIMNDGNLKQLKKVLAGYL